MFFAILWTDSLVLGHYASPADFAVYAIVVSLLHPASFVSTAVGQMFAPRIAAEDARGDHSTLSRMLKRVTYWNTATSVPIFAALIVLATPILGLFGDAYRAGAAALAILAAGQLLNTAAGPLGQLINLSGRPYITMVNNSLVAIVNVGTCLVLVPRYGLPGAALSTASALTLVNLIKLVQVRAIFGMWPFRVDTLRALAAAGLAAGVAAACAFVPPWPNAFLQGVVPSMLLVAAYGVFVWGLGMNEEDRELLAAGRARLARRLGRRRRRRAIPAAATKSPTLEVRKP
jgi:O-antigen/teichoic acid export membrane protein